MLGWVYRAAQACGPLKRVLIATDSEEIMDFARERGFAAMMTPVECASGTDRVFAVAQSVEADIYVNIQGDEPLLTPAHIEALLAPFRSPQVEVSTLSVPCTDEEIHNPNAVKVVTALDGRALYFSRSAIPFDRDAVGFRGYRKHLGLYAYRKAALARFAALSLSPLEQVERLEQLRLLENGLNLYVADAPGGMIGVDTESDRQAVEQILRARRSAGQPSPA